MSPPSSPASAAADLLRSLLRIRIFEEVLVGAEQPGFQLLSSGEEAVAVGIAAAMGPDDQLLSSGRAIGPALALGVPPAAVMGELLGRITGPCQGIAGRGHLSSPAHGLFGSHAVVAGNLTVAAGAALARQLQKSPGVIVCLFGDGAAGAGPLHETLNIARLWDLPLVLVCNNNQYSISTPVAQGLAPQPLSSLAQPFRIPASTVDGMDVAVVLAALTEALDRARRGEGPTFVECLSYRFNSHSTSSRETRPADEVKAWTERCPIERHKRTALASGALRAEQVAQIEREVEAECRTALAQALLAPFPDPEKVLELV